MAPGHADGVIGNPSAVIPGRASWREPGIHFAVRAEGKTNIGELVGTKTADWAEGRVEL